MGSDGVGWVRRRCWRKAEAEGVGGVDDDDGGWRR